MMYMRAVIKYGRKSINMLGLLAQITFIAAIVLWGAIFVVFVVIRVRTMIQRRKYSVKQVGDVSTSYESKGLH